MVFYDENIPHPAIERIKALRELMSQEGIDYILINSQDAHLSEYVAPTDRIREYFTGFTGSNGTLIAGMEEAVLFTDSRYFLQAESELKGSGISLMRCGEKGALKPSEYLSRYIWDGQKIGLDYHTVSMEGILDLKAVIPSNCETVDISEKLGMIWTDRPARDFNETVSIPLEDAGKSTEDKLADIRQIISDNYVGAEESYSYVVSDLTAIMWILNLRGSDIDYVKVAFSYLVIEANLARLYIKRAKLSAADRERLENAGIIINDYGYFYKDLDNMASDVCLLDFGSSCAAIVEKLNENIEVRKVSDSALIRKYIKNDAEICGMRKAHERDAAVMISFIRKIKEMTAQGDKINEYEAGRMLDEMRLSNSECVDLSFETICAYGTNAAIVHYTADKDNCAMLENHGFLLVDSGGHYVNGTTDITRTICLGPLSEEEKKCYTAVLKGNLAISDCVFKEGIRGDNLDILARKPIWDAGYDYGHGTGHGIGLRLSVHEDPVRISWAAKNKVALVPGVIVSDEPGIYEAGKFGIRTENVLLVKEADKSINNENFRCFESLTLVPFDRDAIIPGELSEHEKILVNEYHERILKTILPLLEDEKDAAFIKEACSPIV